MDSSASVGTHFWENRYLPFVRSFATERAWNVGNDVTSLDTFQFAVVRYSTASFLDWDWSGAQTSNRRTLRTAISKCLDIAFVGWRISKN